MNTNEISSALTTIADSQKAVADFLRKFSPILEYFANRAKYELELEKTPEELELKKLRRDREMYELRKCAAKRARIEDEEKAAAEEADREAARAAKRAAREDEYEHKRELETLKAKQGMKLTIAQGLGPKHPNLHVGGTIRVKYLDCFRENANDYRAEVKIVFEQGLVVTEDEWKNLIVNEILVPVV